MGWNERDAMYATKAAVKAHALKTKQSSHRAKAHHLSSEAVANVASARVMKIATQLFKEADADKSGTICANEATTLIQKMRARLGETPLSPEALACEQRAFLEHHDSNADGSICKVEFFQMLCSEPWRQMLPEDCRGAFEAAVKAQAPKAAPSSPKP